MVLVRRSLLLACVLVLPATAHAQNASSGVQARAAEILKATNIVETRRGAQAPWVPAHNGQELLRGDSVRTNALSVASLTFTGGVQWQLAAESELNLEEALAGGTASIIVRLERGGAVARWTPDRRTGNMAKVTVRTASGEAGITGTEWSMRVDEDGRTALLVLDGSVELTNDRGAITVHANEAGEMRVGQAPSLLRLVSPRDRVQWVAAYVASTARYAASATGAARTVLDQAATAAADGRTADAIERLEQRVAGDAATDAATYLALTDLLIGAGEFDRAKARGEAGTARYPRDARFDALLARIALLEDRPAAGRELADAAIAKDRQAVDGWLALGDWATREGDAPVARRAFTQATQLVPNDARGWFGLGHVATEREEFRPARRLLGQALMLDPKGPGYRGELGTLETLADRFQPAEREYARALQDRPDDYVALTGRALLALKEGRDADALDLLLRATLLEPRYARAQLYSGVAYYRLRRTDDAIRALQRASTLDPRDPLPYMMLSQIYTDLYEPWKAVQAGQSAQERMPYLKSLNQLSNTPKGGANLGAALALFGVEDWAQHLAQESYSPYWAGSHLFLGDRYAGQYARASEYGQGILIDPTVLGGSPGYQPLLPRPDAHLTAPLMIGRNQFDGFALEDHTIEPAVTVNGYANRWRPIGYVLGVDAARSSSGSSGTAITKSLAGGIGIKPTPDWSAVVQGSYFNTDFSVTGTHFGAVARRVDGAVQYRLRPTSMLAVKAGIGTADLSVSSSNGLFTTGARPQDVQLQHAVSLGERHQVAWGLELARVPSPFEGPIGLATGSGTLTDRSQIAYVSDRVTAGPHLLIQADLVGTSVRERIRLALRDTEGHVVSGTLPSAGITRTLPRFGAIVRFAPGRLVRLAYQATTSPLGALSTLGPVATAGIPLDDSFDIQLGEIHRARGQVEWQWSQRTFTTGFVDDKRFGPVTTNRDPRISSITDYLARLPLLRLRNELRDVSQLNVASPALLEDTVAVPAESRATVAGVALNHLLTTQISVASQYYWTDSRTGGPASSRSTPLPYYPAHAFSAGATWVSPLRVYVSASMMYRSRRTGEIGGVSSSSGKPAVFEPDWEGTIAASWETPDKRWSLESLVSDLFTTALVRGPTPHPSASVTIKYRR